MKDTAPIQTGLILLGLGSLLWGCTGSTRDPKRTVQLAGPCPSPEASAPRLEPVPQQPSRPLIYLSGEFTRTGRYTWTNGMTLQDGIDAAGGFTKWANGRLQLIHRNGSKERYRLGPGRTLTNNPALQPEDMVISSGHLPPVF